MIAIWAFALGCSGTGGKPPGGGPNDSGHSSDDTGTPVEDDGIGLQFDGAHPKNLLVISVDTLRRDYSGFFDDKGLTPNLTAIFSAGVLLEDHHSCSNWTAPSFMCAQTGRLPLDDGYWPSGLEPASADDRVQWPPPDIESIAGILTRAGYRTELITTNSCFSLQLNGGAYGFETETRAFNQSATAAIDLALDSATALEEEAPWYLHVHLMDPHGPYEAPASFRPDQSLDCSKWNLNTSTGINNLMWVAYPSAASDEQAEMMACIVNEYSAEVRYMDDEVGRLWAQFEKRGLLDDTLVVFFSDHGEQFDEHGRFQHTWSLYREENAAVAAFWAKNVHPMVWSGPTIHQDLAPTILDALEVAPGDHTGVIVGSAPDDRALVTFNAMLDWGGTMIAAEKDGQKLIYWWTGGKKYFDLSLDPSEMTDVYDPGDPGVLALWQVLDAKIDEARTYWPDLVPTDAEP